MASQIMADCPADEAALLAAPFVADKSRSVQDILNDSIATIGENMLFGHFTKMTVEAGKPGMIGHYIHSNGKIAVLVEMQAGNDAAVSNEAFQDLAKNVSMQIAATTPLAVTADSLDPALIEREREVYREKAREEGKPENIVEKIAEGAVKKYCKEVCLLDQPYIRDDKQTINDVVKAAAKTIGAPVSVVRFVRLQLGAE